MRPNFRQIDEAVDLAQEVIVRDMTLKAEAVEQRLLHHRPFAHHRVSPRFTVKSESAARHRGSDFFNKIDPELPFKGQRTNGREARESGRRPNAVVAPQRIALSMARQNESAWHG